MPSERRLEKINELIYRFISELLRKELDVDSLVTVSSVSTSGNGQDCTIGVTVFPFEKSEIVLKEIEKRIYEIQKRLNRGLNMRPVPKIRFKIDESEEKGSGILKKISDIEKNKP
jgi:ribosome-binding factor A